MENKYQRLQAMLRLVANEQPPVAETPDCPAFGRMMEIADGKGVPMTDAEEAHISTCQYCQRLITKARDELAKG